MRIKKSISVCRKRWYWCHPHTLQWNACIVCWKLFPREKYDFLFIPFFATSNPKDFLSLRKILYQLLHLLLCYVMLMLHCACQQGFFRSVIWYIAMWSTNSKYFPNCCLCFLKIHIIDPVYGTKIENFVFWM